MAIIGRIEYLKTFYVGNPFWEKAMNYFERILTKDSIDSERLLALPINAFERHYICDDIFALEQRFISKQRSDCFIESHMKYVDIQMIFMGSELMETTHIKNLKEKITISDRDLIVYHDFTNMNKVPLTHGDFGVYFPEDAHLGCQMLNNRPVECFKTVIKMPCTYLSSV